ncbi:MAG: hypothetical protein IJN16_09960, partial [Lachnospiraceae bacterium]|nr:hypothetical protein [Lachnospiraceae bacterium]
MKKKKRKLNYYSVIKSILFAFGILLISGAAEQVVWASDTQTATGSALMLMTTSDTDIASGSSYGMDWVIDAEGTLTITGVCDEVGSTRPEYGWQDYLEEIKKVYLDAAVGTAFYRAFADAVNLTEVTYGPNFDSSGLWVYESATLVDVFGNTGLETIDFSMWDFSEFEDLGNLFGYASYPNTKHVSFAGCDFSNVTDMSAMFYEMDT